MVVGRLAGEAASLRVQRAAPARYYSSVSALVCTCFARHTTARDEGVGHEDENLPSSIQLLLVESLASSMFDGRV